jgi:1-aminocyclopropane-1-carboxylate deaminase/D-cysteine desulfhydrase-like pyridoxal-dependent ACC family enzyme
VVKNELYFYNNILTMPVDTKLYNPPVVVSKHKHKGKTFSVFRDDFLVGGTKQRALVPFIEKHSKYDEFVYAGPTTGYAQVALAYATHLTGKKAILFLDKWTPRTALTSFAAEFKSVKLCEIKNGYLKVISARAKKYVKTNKKSLMLEFGGNQPDYIKLLYKSLKDATSHIKVVPARIWLVAGSATILACLYKLYPNTHFMVVQVGKTIWPDQINERTTLFISKEKFYDVAKKQPPYPTVATYDAKLWTFFLKHGKTGDFIWNVGGDITNK